MSVVVALIIGELLLHVYAASISAPEKMDPGLIQYHSRYGWRLTPNWQGRHQHADYDVNYKIDARGYRDSVADVDMNRPLVLVAGDSFTFGLGVDNGETYVDELNRLSTSVRYLNAAVPGYAPEQTLLVAENLVQLLKPERLLFVVYLGNDLVDIGLPFPVQAQQAKPYASLDSGDWQITNIPVPKVLKPDELKGKGLSSYIVEPGSTFGLLGRSKIVQLLQESGFVQGSAKLNQAAIHQSMLLFAGVLDRLERIAQDTEVQILLIPGATAVKVPNSLAGRYQRNIADQITQLVTGRPMQLLDTLDSGVFSDAPMAFFENDGHLTPAGHKLLADHLHTKLTQPSSLGD